MGKAVNKSYLGCLSFLLLLYLLHGLGQISQPLTHETIKCRSLCCVQLFASSWTVACLAPLSMGFSRHGSGLPFSSPGDLLNPEVEHRSPMLEADSWPQRSLVPWPLKSGGRPAFRPLCKGFPGSVGVNSDFRDLEGELALKTGPWTRTTGGVVFQQLPPEPWGSPGMVTGVESLHPGPPESVQTA